MKWRLATYRYSGTTGHHAAVADRIHTPASCTITAATGSTLAVLQIVTSDGVDALTAPGATIAWEYLSPANQWVEPDGARFLLSGHTFDAARPADPHSFTLVGLPALLAGGLILPAAPADQTRTLTGTSYLTGLRDLVAQAQARGALSRVSLRILGTADSAAPITVPARVPIFAALRTWLDARLIHLEAAGMLMGGEIRARAWSTGRDLTNQVVLRPTPGTTVALPVTDTHSSTPTSVAAWLDGEDQPPTWLRRAASEQWGIIEAADGTGTREAALAALDAPQVMRHMTSEIAGDHDIVLPFRDLQIGDLISVIDPDTGTLGRDHVSEMSLTIDIEGQTSGYVSLGSRPAEPLDRLAAKVI